MQEIKTRLKAILTTLEDVLSDVPGQIRLDAISRLFGDLTDMHLDDLGDLMTQVLEINGTKYWDFIFSGEEFDILVSIKTGTQESYEINFDFGDD